ncbi:MAG: tannase/feruloyl esterase family alpha/beta hydrolase [Bryobacteraceae bacterium]
MLTRLVIAYLISFALVAQNAPHLGDWKPPASESRQRPITNCAALRSMTGYEFTVATAVEEPSRDGIPSFCRILGQVQPDIRLEVALPAAWNGRLYMFGNGGYAGENIEAAARLTRRNEALSLGFAVAQTNTGHDAEQEPLGTFAVNSQKLYDYAFRAVHVTAMTAKKLAAAYYGSSPSRSYFVGCSTGGRQALISAQRFPEDFDGIVAGAPVLNFSGTMVYNVAVAQALARAPIPPEKLKTLADRIYFLCDAIDGVKDGLIEDPRRCGFRASRDLPRCPAGTDSPDCFTADQIRTLEVIYGEVSAGGKRISPGWPVGAEIAEPNGRSAWERWIIPRDNEPTRSAVFAETFFRYLAYPQKDPNWQLEQFDFERDVPRTEWIAKVLNATDTDLSAFRDRGGRLLMWFGWADPALNPLFGVEYFESVVQRMGSETRNFFRLFMLPGVFHCAGGPGCASFDPLAPLIEWVEHGKAPDRLTASRRDAAGKVVRSRPLCPYPQVAKYKGAGSIDDAASFTCAEPE